ncbi:MAG: hypothetical protein ACMUEL_02360 [Flavobacteriales bacterium Tduv]
MIVDASIAVNPFAPKGKAPTYVVEDRKKEGQKQISQRKESVKRDLIRSRDSRKMAQEIR